MLSRFRGKEEPYPPTGVREDAVRLPQSAHEQDEKPHHHVHLPGFNHNGHKITKGIHPDGESGRGGVHPWHFIRICFRSTSHLSLVVNVLWPFVPAAIAIHFARPDLHLWIFILNYIAMVPTANLVGFAGQELARKLPKVLGLILETFLGGIVEIVLFMVLLHNSVNTSLIPVIRAAILGSILANLLLCLGFCFFVGGLRKKEQEFDEVISEVGNGQLLMAGFGLLIPSAFYSSLRGSIEDAVLEANVLHISRTTSVILLVAFLMQGTLTPMHTHHGLYADSLEKDEERDVDRHLDLAKDKLTFTECIVALLIALTCVSLHAVFLVEEIEFIVNEHGVSDAFMGLILVPLVEKAAEHLTAVDEAWDNQMNFALAHCMGATIQTALFNSSLVVIVGWGLHKPMDLNFEIFNIVVLIMAIIVVGNFLRDQKSNYLEAIASWYYPNPTLETTNTAEGGGIASNGTVP
ncbi:MAG: hypothetical protein ALECFALPRED_002798 [Alectoria fallacina]|uniref:Vacuolar calcium ion transporter n=1 Tax=Alectoria fallacina TaxID=1903189 RepID=A0A8H3FMK3_9LECA|nr:MAG: hypothetical protein ALECFALPRED_002798 [Alectoria fallacina]